MPISFIGAIRLLPSEEREVGHGLIAKRLRSKSRVLRSDNHGDGIIERQRDQCQHDGGHEQGLRRRAALADPEDANPEEPDPNCRDANKRATEEKKNEECEQDIIDWEDLGRPHQHPIDWVEDVDVSKNISAAVLAEGVLGLVDGRQ